MLLANMTVEVTDKRYTIEPMTVADTADTILFLRQFFFKVCTKKAYDIRVHDTTFPYFHSNMCRTSR